MRGGRHQTKDYKLCAWRHDMPRPCKLTISLYLFARWHLFRHVGCKLTFHLLTLKVVSESRVTWATSVLILVFLGLSALELGPMYATDRRQTKASLNAFAYEGGGIIIKPVDGGLYSLHQTRWIRHRPSRLLSTCGYHVRSTAVYAKTAGDSNVARTCRVGYETGTDIRITGTNDNSSSLPVNTRLLPVFLLRSKTCAIDHLRYRQFAKYLGASVCILIIHTVSDLRGGTRGAWPISVCMFVPLHSRSLYLLAQMTQLVSPSRPELCRSVGLSPR